MCWFPIEEAEVPQPQGELGADEGPCPLSCPLHWGLRQGGGVPRTHAMGHMEPCWTLSHSLSIQAINRNWCLPTAAAPCGSLCLTDSPSSLALVGPMQCPWP